MQKIYLILLCAIIFPFTTISDVFAQTSSCNDFVGTLPSSADIKSKFVTGHLITNSYIHIKSANFTGISYDPKCRSINTETGVHVQGTLNIETYNSGPRFGVYDIAATTTWGPHQSSYWDVGKFGTGLSTSTVDANFTAPTVPGIYYIIVAGRWELDAAKVMSGTSSGLSGLDWNQGHDVASWDSTQIGLAREYGITVGTVEDKTGTSKNYIPADAIKVIVTASSTTPTQPPATNVPSQPIPGPQSAKPSQPNQFTDTISHLIPNLQISNLEKLTMTPIAYALLTAIIVLVSLTFILRTRRKKIAITKVAAKDKSVLIPSIAPKPSEDKIMTTEKEIPAVMIEKPIDQAGKKELHTKVGISESASLDQTDAIKKNQAQQDSLVDLTSKKLETLRNEYNSTSNQLESIKKELQARNTELSTLDSERQSLISEMQSIKSELSETNSKLEAAKSELGAFQSKKDEMGKEITRVKKELAFIELQLANVGKAETDHILKAASSIVAEVNAKYEATKKELEAVKALLAKMSRISTAKSSEESKEFG